MYNSLLFSSPFGFTAFGNIRFPSSPCTHSLISSYDADYGWYRHSIRSVICLSLLQELKQILLPIFFVHHLPGGCSVLITWFCTHSKKLMSGFLSEMCWRLVLYLHVRQSQKCRVNCNVLGLGHFHQKMQHGVAENSQGSCGNCSASCVCRELSAVLSASSSVRYYRVKSTQ